MSTSTITATTDRIEKEIRLPAPPSRVWRALTDPGEFGRWFGVALSGDAVPGATLRGPITIKGYEHVMFEAIVETVEPERRYAFRWHPYAVEPGVDYSNEPRTLVVFTLQPVDGGTLLKVVESGFDAIPASRRAKAFEMNSNGWAFQLGNIARHVAQ
jgi:uncharacterized protein YndB with AHSA1/START domain